MWREETSHSALPDLWTAAAVCAAIATGMFTTEEGRSREEEGVSGLISWSALLMSQDLYPCFGQGLTPRGYIKTIPDTWPRS